MHRYHWLFLFLAGWSLSPDLAAGKPLHKQETRLCSWAPGPANQLETWLSQVTSPGPDFIPTADRIAVFDLDGTLLVERPDYFHGFVSKNFIREKAKRQPELREHPFVQAVLNRDETTIRKNLMEFLLFSFEGETWDTVREFTVRTGRTVPNPLFEKPWAELFYRPMLEWMELLRSRGFAVYVVTTSQQDVIAAFCQDVLGIEPRFVIGSAPAYEWDFENRSLVRRNRFLEPLNHGPGKPARIWDRIGAFPVMAAGNSMNDADMLRSTELSGYRSLAMVLVHDHPDEVVYDKPDILELARKKGWLVVSMKRDFVQLWDPPEPLQELEKPPRKDRNLLRWIALFGTIVILLGTILLVVGKSKRGGQGRDQSRQT